MEVVSLSEVTNAQAAEWLVDLAEDLRQSDLDELAATSGEDPAVALVSSVMESTHAWVVVADGDPICAFGVAPIDEEGIVWMLGSPKMDLPRNRLAILRRSQAYLDILLAAYPRLFNHIDARNERSMEWLRWLGFEIVDADLSFGIEGRPFFLFERLR